MKKGEILVNGSVVIDTILGKQFYGGTGANIAYGLGLLGASPMLFSIAGKDCKNNKKKNFNSHLKKIGVDLRIYVDKKYNTASFSCVTNKNGEQTGKWRPNAYKKINKIPLTKTIRASKLKKVAIAIFSPGTPKSIYKHLREFRNFNREALAIFDPGQMINFYSKKQLTDCINLADIFIVNEKEYASAKRILKKDPGKITQGKIMIETRGAKGSVIFQNGKKITIPAITPRRVLDTTGAGDAYRAGLIFSLWQGKSLLESCILGARIASKSVESIGCQKYKIPKSLVI